MKNKLFWVLTLLTMTWVGCVNEEEELLVLDGSQLAINIEGGIEQQYISRVNDNGFCGGDEVGIYGVNYTSGNTVAGVLNDEGNQVDNVRYTYNEENLTWTASRPVYYKDAETHIDLYGYYPYGSPEDVNAYSFEVAKDQSGNGTVNGYEMSDFLWGKAVNISPSKEKVKISFNHRMACANVVLTEGTGFSTGEFDRLDKAVMVLNTSRTATVDLATGIVKATGEATNEGTVMMATAEGFRAIVVPQTVAAQTALFSITVDGVDYRFKPAEAITFTSGKQSQFTIEISKKEFTGDYVFTLTGCEIVDWIADTKSHGGEARQYYVVHLEEPGTLEAKIQEAGKDPNKIKNLKVSGKICDIDFVFMNHMEILQAVNLKESVITPYYRLLGKLSDENDRRDLCLFVDKELGNSDEVYQAFQDAYPTLEYIDSYYYLPGYQIPDDAFYGKSSLVHFVFPEKVTKIGSRAFSQTTLSGALIIPNDVVEISSCAFQETNISSLQLPANIKTIGGSAFGGCSSLSGSLSLPESIEYLGSGCFQGCSMLSGTLSLPSKLKTIEWSVFCDCRGLIGDLSIPEGVTSIGGYAFSSCFGLNGTLKIPESVKEIGSNAFWHCSFQGELVLPKELNIISHGSFDSNDFTSVVLPEELIKIENDAFSSNSRLTEPIDFPESLITIESNAFSYCQQLTGIHLKSNLTTIGSSAFAGCYSLSSIACDAITPPAVGGSAFSGVAKDNFTLEVPEGSIVEYQTTSGWSDFRRIGAYYDFSISRPLVRALNGSYTRKLILRAPSEYAWSIESKPDWITVTPSSGVGKTEVTVEFHAMSDAEVENIVYDAVNGNGNYVGYEYEGRRGEVVFLLDGKNYRSTMAVEQYDSDVADGQVITNQVATQGQGVNIVFMGDCFDAKDISDGKYLQGINEAIEHYFAIEPYHTYKPYFNIYTVVGMSDDSGMGTVNTVKDAKFGSQYSLDGITPDTQTTFEYAMKAAEVNESNLSQTLVVMVENTADYGGICYMWGDGSAIAVCPMSSDAYPYDFRGIVQHEAGGHGFAKLGDEYIYHNAFIQSCTCVCCSHVNEFNAGKALGWYRNLSLSGNMDEVPWSHLIYHPQYSNIVDMYEGGYYHSRGIYRSESTSCMNNNIPYYSAISRQEMVERIMRYAGETFSLEDFYAKDVKDASSRTEVSRATSVFENMVSASRQHAPKYMGDKPVLR